MLYQVYAIGQIPNRGLLRCYSLSPHPGFTHYSIAAITRKQRWQRVTTSAATASQRNAQAAGTLVGSVEPDNGFGLGRAPDNARPVTVDSTRDRPLSRQQGGRGGGNAVSAVEPGPAAGRVSGPDGGGWHIAVHSSARQNTIRWE